MLNNSGRPNWGIKVFWNPLQLIDELFAELFYQETNIYSIQNPLEIEIFEILPIDFDFFPNDIFTKINASQFIIILLFIFENFANFK